MASRKMTFSIPEPLASEFLHSVPAQDRSRYVAEALAARLRKQDEALALACEAANRDPDILLMEKEFDAIAGEIPEPWSDAPAR